MLDLAPRPTRRRPSLTPMIDVVFLLLVFFMMVARFGLPVAQPLTLTSTGGSTAYQGPPRLVTLTPQGVLLNGRTTDDLAADLALLMTSPGDLIVLRAVEGADIQQLAQTLAILGAAGFGSVAVVD